jgi:hypothetical protein
MTAFKLAIVMLLLMHLATTVFFLMLNRHRKGRNGLQSFATVSVPVAGMLILIVPSVYSTRLDEFGRTIVMGRAFAAGLFTLAVCLVLLLLDRGAIAAVSALSFQRVAGTPIKSGRSLLEWCITAFLVVLAAKLAIISALLFQFLIMPRRPPH